MCSLIPLVKLGYLAVWESVLGQIVFFKFNLKIILDKHLNKITEMGAGVS